VPYYHVNTIINSTALEKAIGNNIKYIYLYPKYSCATSAAYTFNVITPMMQYAAFHQLKLNTGFVARYGSNCSDTFEEIVQSNKEESVYIFSKLDYKNLNQVFDVFQEKTNLVCQDLDAMYVCRFQIKST
jgi:hypothetical protein